MNEQPGAQGGLPPEGWEPIGVEDAVAMALAQHASRHAAPASLRRALAMQLDTAQEARAPRPSLVHAMRALPGRVRALGLRWLLPAGGWITASALALLMIVPAWNAQDSDPYGPAAYVENHARARITDHAIDIASSDRHTVKPWFAGKLDYAPPCPDLSAQGFALVGGRLEYVQRRRTAVLVYQRRQHRIDVYLAPLEDGDVQGSAASELTRRGFHQLSWRSAGMRFVAVSDLETAELRELVTALNAALAR